METTTGLGERIHIFPALGPVHAAKARETNEHHLRVDPAWFGKILESRSHYLTDFVIIDLWHNLTIALETIKFYELIHFWIPGFHFRTDFFFEL